MAGISVSQHQLMLTHSALSFQCFHYLQESLFLQAWK